MKQQNHKARREELEKSELGIILNILNRPLYL
jgi:hypothetical protein